MDPIDDPTLHARLELAERATVAELMAFLRACGVVRLEVPDGIARAIRDHTQEVARILATSPTLTPSSERPTARPPQGTWHAPRPAIDAPRADETPTSPGLMPRRTTAKRFPPPTIPPPPKGPRKR
jgi:hypothetical protein